MSETHAGAHAHTHRVASPHSFPGTPTTHRLTRTQGQTRVQIHTHGHTIAQRARKVSQRYAHSSSLPATRRRAEQHRHTYAHTQSQMHLNADVQTHRGPPPTRTYMQMPTQARGEPGVGSQTPGLVLLLPSVKSKGSRVWQREEKAVTTLGLTQVGQGREGDLGGLRIQKGGDSERLGCGRAFVPAQGDARSPSPRPPAPACHTLPAEPPAHS